MDNESSVPVGKNFNSTDSIAYSQDLDQPNDSIQQQLNSAQNFDTSRHDKPSRGELLRSEYEVGGDEVVTVSGALDAIKDRDESKGSLPQLANIDSRKAFTKSIHVRKQLKFQNGLLVPQSDA